MSKDNSTPKEWMTDGSFIFFPDQSKQEYEYVCQLFSTSWVDDRKDTEYGNARANAELIVKAVNHYDQLVETLGNTLAEYQQYGQLPSSTISRIESLLYSLNK